MKIIRLFFPLIVCLTFVCLLIMCAPGCKSRKPVLAPAALNEDGNPQNAVYEVKAGDTLEVHLKKNPSYRLHYLLLNEKQLKHTRFLGERYVSRQNGETPMPGAGGTAVYTFKAMDTGTDTLRFGKQPVSNNHPRDLAYKLDTLAVTHQFLIKIR